jgi:hypothetical protein
MCDKGVGGGSLLSKVLVTSISKIEEKKELNSLSLSFLIAIIIYYCKPTNNKRLTVS